MVPRVQGTLIGIPLNGPVLLPQAPLLLRNLSSNAVRLLAGLSHRTLENLPGQA
jgi:hypothetical protein